MRELKIGSVMIILGLFMLFLSEYYHEPTRVKISEIDDDLYGDNIRVSGVISDIVDQETIKIIEIEGKDIDFVYFDNLDDINEGKKVSINGQVEKYQGDLQVVVDGINHVE